jgi:hypothetical protein
MFTSGKLNDMVEFLIDVVNNNKLYSIKFKDPLCPIGGDLEVGHLKGSSNDVDHFSLFVLNSNLAQTMDSDGMCNMVFRSASMALALSKQGMGLLKFDEFKKDVGLSSGG